MKKLMENKKVIMGAAALAAVAGTGYIGYKYYKNTERRLEIIESQLNEILYQNEDLEVEVA